jgi:phosphoribosylaminoimidazolecarboxamide formyltransferase/IMP cyclohydrolase
MNRIKTALISVSDKTGLVPFARALIETDIEIFSTGGTGQHLLQAGIGVCDISAYTDFPELMDGRLKTLHPKVFGGILARRDHPKDLASLRQHEIRCFDLVVVNLYPFEATVARAETTVAEAIEKIDIGGPSLIRAAAKNHVSVTIVTVPDQYDLVAAEIRDRGQTRLETRQALAVQAFRHTAHYDRAIASYFAQTVDSARTASTQTREGETAETESPISELPIPEMAESIAPAYDRVTTLRYGENPHQRAALYAIRADNGLLACAGVSIIEAKQLNGKALSYNNYLDLDAAIGIVQGFAAATVSVIKHNNPCGVASDEQIEVALQKALDGDPTSAFGSILGLNREVDEACAEVLAMPGLFVEAIIAPSFSPAAQSVLTTKPKWKRNVRLMAVGPLESPRPGMALRPIAGGALVQDVDNRASSWDEWKVVTRQSPTQSQLVDLRFSWEVVRHVRSNAITICRDRSTCGVGAGQMSRVDAVEIAIRKAADRAEGAVLASDAFFPFPDSIEAAAAAGVTAVVQPGGSRNDEGVIGACDRLGLAMMLTGRRHFKH